MSTLKQAESRLTIHIRTIYGGAIADIQSYLLQSTDAELEKESASWDAWGQQATKELDHISHHADTMATHAVVHEGQQLSSTEDQKSLISWGRNFLNRTSEKYLEQERVIVDRVINHMQAVSDEQHENIFSIVKNWANKAWNGVLTVGKFATNLIETFIDKSDLINSAEETWHDIEELFQHLQDTWNTVLKENSNILDAFIDAARKGYFTDQLKEQLREGLTTGPIYDLLQHIYHQQRQVNNSQARGFANISDNSDSDDGLVGKYIFRSAFLKLTGDIDAIIGLHAEFGVAIDIEKLIDNQDVAGAVVMGVGGTTGLEIGGDLSVDFGLSLESVSDMGGAYVYVVLKGDADIGGGGNIVFKMYPSIELASAAIDLSTGLEAQVAVGLKYLYCIKQD